MNNFNEKCASCIYKDTCIEHPFNCESYIDENSVGYSATGLGDIIPNNTVEIGVGLENKSRLKVGNLIIYNTHHFNWFHRKMWKLLLGFDIENVEE